MSILLMIVFLLPWPTRPKQHKRQRKPGTDASERRQERDGSVPGVFATARAARFATARDSPRAWPAETRPALGTVPSLGMATNCNYAATFSPQDKFRGSLPTLGGKSGFSQRLGTVHARGPRRRVPRLGQSLRLASPQTATMPPRLARRTSSGAACRHLGGESRTIGPVSVNRKAIRMEFRGG